MKKFYMVVGVPKESTYDFLDRENGPTKMHSSRHEAEQEMIRLAQENLSKDFVLLESKTAITSTVNLTWHEW